jgi:hypothetical protein
LLPKKRVLLGGGVPGSGPATVAGPAPVSGSLRASSAGSPAARWDFAGSGHTISVASVTDAAIPSVGTTSARYFPVASS